MSGILDKYILRELGEVSAHTRGNLQEAWVECQSMYCGCTQRETKGQWKRNRKTLKIISLTLYFCLELAIVTIYPQMKEWIQFSSFIMKRKRFFVIFFILVPIILESYRQRRILYPCIFCLLSIASSSFHIPIPLCCIPLPSPQCPLPNTWFF